MKRKLVFWTAFNSYQSSKLLKDKSSNTVHPVQTILWTKKRTMIWRKYTLKSILNQTYEDFLYIVLLDIRLKHITKHILPRIADDRVIYCYKDKPILKRLRKYDEIVFVLIDNDDMYSRRAGELMMGCQAEWMYFKHGYAYEPLENRLWTYDTVGTGPFWARRLDPKTMARFDRDKRHPTHKAVIHQNPERLPGGNFCVLLHGDNTSSTVKMRNIQKRANLKILKEEFGL